MVVHGMYADDVKVNQALSVLEEREPLDVRRFFNTMLGFEIEVQHKIGAMFFGHFSDVIKEAKLAGTYEGNGKSVLLLCLC